MNKQTIITALLALVAIVVNAQQTLTVRDSLTQEPVAYTSKRIFLKCSLKSWSL